VRALARGEQLLQIANRISSLHSECFGRGPARARAYHEDNFVFVVLEGCFIDAEQTLVRHGRDSHVRVFRESFQEVLRSQFIEIVEEVLGREVRDYTSSTLTRSDVVVEIFHLA
jgi:uncharacterized protein YbcI